MKRRDLLIHIISWSILICFPLVGSHNDPNASVMGARLVRSLGGPLAYMVMFYLNFLWLVPRRLLNKRHKSYFAINVAIIVCGALFQVWWWRTMTSAFPELEMLRPRRPHNAGIPWHIYLQSALTMMLFGGLSVALCLSTRLQKVEQARQEAELKNLQNQLNPHFLLNTLNNIYALIAFDPQKAQNTVAELSRLLRYVLYETREEQVPLGKEAAFINDYIELMRIRQSQNVKVDTSIDIAPDDATPIAPLLFISIIENAFKHGVSTNGTGHIGISLSRQGGTVTCKTTNTNHPKNAQDKSGHGIGLEQVKRRLELMYSGRYDWQKFVDNDTNEYISTITLSL